MAEDWTTRSACRGLPTQWWYPEHVDAQWRKEAEAFAARGIIVAAPVRDDSKAKAICAECPVAKECMVTGVLKGEDTGIWAVGGQRRRFLRKQLSALDERQFLAVVEQEIVLLRSGYLRQEIKPLQRCERCARQGLSSWLHEGVRPDDVNGPNALCGKGVTYARGCRCFYCRMAHALRISGRGPKRVAKAVPRDEQRTDDGRRRDDGTGAGGSQHPRPAAAGCGVPGGIPGPDGGRGWPAGPDGGAGRPGGEYLQPEPELALVAG